MDPPGKLRLQQAHHGPLPRPSGLAVEGRSPHLAAEVGVPPLLEAAMSPLCP